MRSMSVLVCLSLVGCVSVTKVADKIRVPRPETEEALGCAQIVNFSSPLNLNKDQKNGVEPIWLTFDVIVDPTRAADSVERFIIDANREIPVIEDDCIEIIEIHHSDGEVTRKLKTIPRSLVSSAFKPA